MATGLLDLIKRAALDAVDQSKPVNFCFGTVTGVDPVVIQITPTLTISEKAGQVTIPRQCTDYETSITLMSPSESGELPWQTELAEDLSAPNPLAFSSHKHDITGKHRVTIHNKLKVNDKVILARQQGGQHYFVIDKVGESS